MNPKNRCKPGLQSETAVFGICKHLISLNSRPYNKIYPKAIANVGSNHKQRFFNLWKYLMTLRTLLGSMKPKTAVKSYSQITTVFGT
jgi:hypothetical protein